VPFFMNHLSASSSRGYGTFFSVERGWLCKVRPKAEESQRPCESVQDFKRDTGLHAAFSITIVSLSYIK
jgi:hypothetical protein